MKKLAVSFVILSMSGCSFLSDMKDTIMPSYRCYDVGKSEQRCLLEKDYDALVAKGYTEDYIGTLVKETTYGVRNKCNTEKLSGEFIEVCSLSVIEDTEKTYKRNKSRQEAQQAAADEHTETLNAIQKKYNKPFCAATELVSYAFAKKAPPQNCLLLVGAGHLTVLQQTKAGTLVNMQVTQYEDATYFIVSNSKDSGAVDNQRLDAGVFENIGTFQYSNVLGATRTISKLKRIE